MNAYRRWLFAPWKLVTFAAAAASLALIAPRMNDPHWDAPVALIMSALTFATAPFAVATLWRRRSLAVCAGAIACWWLSAGLSFDLYWWARRGSYPDVWRENLIASSFLYLAAGLFWNLDWTPERRLHFSFQAPLWPPQHEPPPVRRLALPIFIGMTLVAAATLLPFWL